jgi:hypothetical protein
MTRLIYDPQEALTWAMAHQMALMLDVKTFEEGVSQLWISYSRSMPIAC